jgi:hypothetical protein
MAAIGRSLEADVVRRVGVDRRTARVVDDQTTSDAGANSLCYAEGRRRSIRDTAATGAGG